MSAYELLVSKVQQEASQNPNYSQFANNLISNGLGMSLDEVYVLNISDSFYLMSLKYLIISLKYLGEAPKGINYSGLSREFIDVIHKIPQECQSVVIPSMTENYLGGLCKELKTQDISEVIVWTKVYSELKSNNIKIQTFEDKLSIKISSLLWNIIGDTNKDTQKCELAVYLAYEAQTNGLDVTTRINLLVSSIHSFLNMTYEMYKGGQRNDLKEVSVIVYRLKLLKIEKETAIQQVKQLEDFFGASYQNPVPQEKPLVTQYTFNLNNATFIKEIYSNNENDKFSVKIYLYICPINGNVAVKAYSRSKPEYDMNRISKEILILKKLSQIARPESCFIKFYGECLTQEVVWFAMEYHETNLMKEITRMKDSGQKFSEIKLIWMAKELISAFAEMENMNIYHQDIKPHNILVTSDGRLKIVDFGVSESRVDHESTSSKTDAHSIQGTRGYMAPELETARKSGLKEANFKSGKADVFSLGITLLQLYCFEELLTLNYEENNQKLMKKVGDIKYPWLSTLLSKMLRVGYNERPSFKKCLEDIPGSSTERTSFYND